MTLLFLQSRITQIISMNEYGTKKCLINLYFITGRCKWLIKMAKMLKTFCISLRMHSQNFPAAQLWSQSSWKRPTVNRLQHFISFWLGRARLYVLNNQSATLKSNFVCEQTLQRAKWMLNFLRKKLQSSLTSHHHTLIKGLKPQARSHTEPEQAFPL